MNPFRTRAWPLYTLTILALHTGANVVRANPLYTVTGLGILPGTSQSVATGINDEGQVVGVSYNHQINGDAAYDPNAQSFLYSNGTVSPVAPLGGTPASAINNHGQIVGGNYASINDGGQYVGTDPSTGVNGLFNPDGTKVTFNGLSPKSINNSGDIAGDLTGSPVIFTNPAAAHGPLGPDTPGFLSFQQPTNVWLGTVSAMNNTGSAIINGIIQRPPSNEALPIHSIIFTSSTGSFSNISNSGLSSGKYIDLTKLPGGTGMQALALNDLGQAVGTQMIGDGLQPTYQNAFLYSNGRITLHNSLLPSASGWDLTRATGINNVGQIIGQGTYNGQSEAFVLTPTTSLEVPEPSTWNLTLFVLSLLGARSLLRRRPAQPHR